MQVSGWASAFRADQFQGRHPKRTCIHASRPAQVSASQKPCLHSLTHAHMQALHENCFKYLLLPFRNLCMHVSTDVYKQGTPISTLQLCASFLPRRRRWGVWGRGVQAGGRGAWAKWWGRAGGRGQAGGWPACHSTCTFWPCSALQGRACKCWDLPFMLVSFCAACQVTRPVCITLSQWVHLERCSTCAHKSMHAK